MPSELNHYFIGIYPALAGRGSGAGRRQGKVHVCKRQGRHNVPQIDDVGDEDRTTAAAAAAGGFRIRGRALTD